MTDQEPEVEIVEVPEYKWIVTPLPDITISMVDRPCWWYRLWMRIFFGWRFEAIE